MVTGRVACSICFRDVDRKQGKQQEHIRLEKTKYKGHVLSVSVSVLLSVFLSVFLSCFAVTAPYT